MHDSGIVWYLFYQNVQRLLEHPVHSSIYVKKRERTKGMCVRAFRLRQSWPWVCPVTVSNYTCIAQFIFFEVIRCNSKFPHGRTLFSRTECASKSTNRAKRSSNERKVCSLGRLTSENRLQLQHCSVISSLRSSLFNWSN